MAKTVVKPSATVVVHTLILQQSGYAAGQRVDRDGVVWISLVNNNVTEPGHSVGGYWDLYA